MMRSYNFLSLITKPNSMKKLVYFALVALVSVAFASCGSKSSSSANGQANADSAAAQSTEVAEAGFTDPKELVETGIPVMFNGGDFAQYVEPSTSAKDKETINGMATENAKGLKESGSSVKEIKVLNVKENGDEATVEISMTMVVAGQEDTNNDDVKLKKVDGKWYFDASEFLN